jgi:uncharacterized RmlC-like cupin family protein
MADGECETSTYVLHGHARFSWGPGGAESVEVGPGAFLAVAPHAVHCEEADRASRDRRTS